MKGQFAADLFTRETLYLYVLRKGAPRLTLKQSLEIIKSQTAAKIGFFKGPRQSLSLNHHGRYAAPLSAPITPSQPVNVRSPVPKGDKGNISRD